MAAYATFADYTGSEYLGTDVGEAEFNQLALRASIKIDSWTFGRAKVVVDEDVDTALIALITKTVCALVDRMHSISLTGENRGLISSETVGKHSVTFVSGSSISDEQSLFSIARDYLGQSGLMFRGA